MTAYYSSKQSSTATTVSSAPREDCPRRLAVLGSTGSIGCNVLDVVSTLDRPCEIVALSAGVNLPLLADQTARFRPPLVSIQNPDDLPALRGLLAQRGVHPLPTLAAGSEGLHLAAVASGAHMVVAATVGVAALSAVHAAIRAGLPIALANKETLIAAGRLIMEEAARSGALILPIDSEHSAIHQCLRSGAADEVERLILTASGGPFRHFSLASLENVTPQEALRHPTWRMGGRITLDSATLMNKGFEVIEACYLFGLDEARVDVVVHPQSIVHSLVEFRDGSIIAQLGTTDMRTPIQYALTWPERRPAHRARLDLAAIARLEFEPPDLRKFPCLQLAREAYRAGGAAGAVLNAADEVAVAAFLGHRIAFPRIATIIRQVLDELGNRPASNLEEILAADAEARQLASRLVDRGVEE